MIKSQSDRLSRPCPRSDGQRHDPLVMDIFVVNLFRSKWSSIKQDRQQLTVPVLLEMNIRDLPKLFHLSQEENCL
jgi:hypothetical protein